MIPSLAEKFDTHLKLIPQPTELSDASYTSSADMPLESPSETLFQWKKRSADHHYESGNDTERHSMCSEDWQSDVGSKYDYNYSDDEEAIQERKAIEEAKSLLTDCIQTSYKLNEYSLSILLGFGTFGIVVQGYDFKSGEKVAIKIMRKRQIHETRYCNDPRTSERVPLEIALLKYAPKHQNIAHYIDSWEDDECWYLVTELGGHSWALEPIDEEYQIPQVASRHFTNKESQEQMLKLVERERLIIRSFASEERVFQRVVVPKSVNDRSLAGFLRRCGAFNDQPKQLPILPEPVQKFIFAQLIDAVDSLHQNGITHKDLKDENVLLDKDLHVVLIDFGHASFYRSPEDSGKRPLFKAYGTPIFSPPEVRSGFKFIGPEADIYALGLMLYEMNYGDVPDNFDLATVVENGDCIFDISERTGFQSENLRDLVRWMLAPDPMDRPLIAEVKNHPWFHQD